jgi:hypothetical protein
MGFHKAVKLEPCHTAHTALGVHPKVAHASGVTQQGGNVFLSDWDVKILAAGSDAAVSPGLLRGFRRFLRCDVLTTVRSARSASLALAGSDRVSVPARWAPCQPSPKLAVFWSLACGSSLAKRPKTAKMAFPQRMTTR